MSGPDPKDYVVGDDAEVTSVDLDREGFTYRGRRLQEADAERIAGETMEELRNGKPSLDQIRSNRRPSYPLGSSRPRIRGLGLCG